MYKHIITIIAISVAWAMGSATQAQCLSPYAWRPAAYYGYYGPVATYSSSYYSYGTPYSYAPYSSVDYGYATPIVRASYYYPSGASYYSNNWNSYSYPSSYSGFTYSNSYYNGGYGYTYPYAGSSYYSPNAGFYFSAPGLYGGFGFGR